MTRQEHLDWCKKEAIKYCEAGAYKEAVISMASDLSKHPETKNHPGIDLGVNVIDDWATK